MLKQYRIKAGFLATFLLLFYVSYAQISISGPACVLPHVIYQYLIIDTSNNGTNGVSQVCLTGGRFFQTNDNCRSDSLISEIEVIWNTNEGDKIINFSNASGNFSFTAISTSPLDPGSLQDSSSVQNIAYNRVPSVIHCGPASGGNCDPLYVYQWQKSIDNLSWTNINGATDANYIPEDSLQITTYYQRKVIEANSGTVGYSGVAVVYVAALPPSNGN